MRLVWSRDAQDDLDRLYAFLASKSQRTADAVVVALLDAPTRLLDMPRMGIRVENFLDEEVRRVIVRQYELRYRIEGEIIRILRIFHTRENR